MSRGKTESAGVLWSGLHPRALTTEADVNTLCVVVMQSLLIALAAGPVACGGGTSGPSHPDDNREMSADFNGEWHGRATLSVATEIRGEVSADVSASVAGAAITMQVRGICDGRAMDLLAEGNGRSTMWYGDETCPVVLAECERATTRYASAIMKVMPDGSLYVLLNGEATGCGTSRAIATEVRATK